MGDAPAARRGYGSCGLVLVDGTPIGLPGDPWLNPPGLPPLDLLGGPGIPDSYYFAAAGAELRDRVGVAVQLP